MYCKLNCSCDQQQHVCTNQNLPDHREWHLFDQLVLHSAFPKYLPAKKDTASENQTVLSHGNHSKLNKQSFISKKFGLLCYLTDEAEWKCVLGGQLWWPSSEDVCLNSGLPLLGLKSRLNHNSDLKFCVLLFALLDACCYGVSTWNVGHVSVCCD